MNIFVGFIPSLVGSYLFNKVLDQSYSIMFMINAFCLLLAVVYSIFRLKVSPVPSRIVKLTLELFAAKIPNWTESNRLCQQILHAFHSVFLWPCHGHQPMLVVKWPTTTNVKNAHPIEHSPLFHPQWQTKPHQRSITEVGCCGILPDFFDHRNLMSSFRTLLRKRPMHRRLYLWMFMIMMALYTFQRDEKPMMYLYTQLKFNWDTAIYSNYRTFQSSAYVLMMLTGIPIMSRVFGWSDTVSWVDFPTPGIHWLTLAGLCRLLPGDRDDWRYGSCFGAVLLHFCAGGVGPLPGRYGVIPGTDRGSGASFDDVENCSVVGTRKSIRVAFGIRQLRALIFGCLVYPSIQQHDRHASRGHLLVDDGHAVVRVRLYALHPRETARQIPSCRGSWRKAGY